MQPAIETDALVIGAGEAGALVASLAVDAGASRSCTASPGGAPA